jgi:epidermal growth factor receptor substrate 15
MLPGEQAKQIFERSGLPNEMLGRIWQLADTELRGALVMTEFVIAMHLLTSVKTGALRGLPTILPAALYEAATRRGSATSPRPQSPTRTAPISAIPRQLSGQAQMRTGSPLGRPPITAPPADDWLVTPGDKARFDLLYEELDKSKRGFITGEQAVPFLSQSNLPEDALAQIWDLADVNSEGRLNKDTFAVAMYLIRQQRSRKDGSSALPTALPPNLIPPSFRNQVRPPSASAFDAPPASQPAPSQPKSALDDLFGLDSEPTPPMPSQPVLTAASSSVSNDPFASSPMPPSSPARASPTTSTFKPFVPSSSFGRSLTSQTTGGSNSSQPSFSRAAPQAVAAPAAPSSALDDLLGDNDAEISKKLNNDSTELANLSNQIGSLSTHMQEVQAKRSATQNDLNQANAQKKNFEQRLSQLRALYEKEAKAVRALEDQLAASRNDTKKLTADMAMVDASYQDLQGQHRQVATALQADQQENANLKERIKATNGEIAQLRPQIEKLKSEARQQKGLVAINKKQLATTEGEREKLKTEVEELTKSNEDLARQLSASPAQAQVASPALSTTSNPFFRRTGSADIMGAFTSPSPPPTKSYNDKSFDDVFGPSFSPPSQSITPVNNFKPQTTGTSTASAGSFATPGTATSPNVSRQATATLEPPAVPESRQITSNFLPFGEASESLTSSRQVSPPASRMGQLDEATLTSLEPAKTGQSATSGSETTKNTLPSPTENKVGDTNEPVFGGPDDEGIKSAPGHSHNNSSNDPFAAMDQAKAKEDFESAFASFKNAKAKSPDTSSSNDATQAFSTFDSEFPPISELEKDDDSDSSSDRGGFDDDFAPVSPKAGDKKETIQPPSSPGSTKTTPKAEGLVLGQGSSLNPSGDLVTRYINHQNPDFVSREG